MRIFMSAGEASGDALGASLLTALKAKNSSVQAFGMGGQRMEAAGLRPIRSARELNVMGIVEVFRHLFRLYRLMLFLARTAIAAEPDLAVLIDAPDFNLRLARRLSRAGVPVVFYVGPSVWAWRPGRVHRFKKVVRRMLLLFPFEVSHWVRVGVDAVCVGHPVVDRLEGASSKPRRDGLLALMPGSRPGEIKRLLPLYLRSAQKLRIRGLVSEIRLLLAPGVSASWVRGLVPSDTLLEVDVLEDASDSEREEVLSVARLAFVASGTATLEVALLGCPQVIVYRLSPLTLFLMRLLRTVDFAGLPNIIMKDSVVPELIQKEATVDNLVASATQILKDDKVLLSSTKLSSDLRLRLAEPGSALRAAQAVLELATSVGQLGND